MSRSKSKRIFYCIYNIIFILVLMTFSFSGCVGDYIKSESRQGYYYVVKKGDTLYRIAEEHKISVDELAELNNLGKGQSIKEGMALFVPDKESGPGIKRKKEVFSKENRKDEEQKIKDSKNDAQGQTKKKGQGTNKTSVKSEKSMRTQKSDIQKNNKAAVPEVNTKVKTEAKDKEIVVLNRSATSTDSVPGEKAAITKENIKQKGVFIWPVKGKVISKYGPQANGMFYNGIRIETETEASVNAAAGGHVIFSALLKDYGETVIIKHENNYATVYTHLTKRLVRVDQVVKRGDKIALIIPASTGVGFIDFEIRYRNKAKDPLLLLS